MKDEIELKFDGKHTKVKQLADFIQENIIAREMKVGDKIPSINKISRRFSVSRDTVFKSLSDLRERGVIDAIHGKNYYVSSPSRNVLLLLDEYSPFKEILHTTLITRLPKSYKIDLWFHQYSKHLFDSIINDSIGKYNKYLVMNYDNESFSDSLSKIDKKKLLLLDFGEFNKDGFSFICQDFDGGLYNALESIKEDLEKYDKLIFVFNKFHKHPQSSKNAFTRFCLDYDFYFSVLNEISDNTVLQENCFYLVIKQEEVVEIVKKGRQDKLKPGRDYGLLAYNENPYFEIIENGISSIGIDWQQMGEIASEFVLNNVSINEYLPTMINKRNSF